jgi:hypothetical protein
VSLTPRDGVSPRRSTVRRRRSLLGAGLLLLAIAFLSGYLAAPSGSPIVVAERPLDSARTVPEVPSATPAAADERTPKGAARAAARALASLADARLLRDPAARAAAVAAIAPAGYGAQLGPLFDRAYEYLGAALGQPSGDDSVVLRMTPLGYRVEAFSGRRASVAVWQLTLLGTPERPSIAAWSTSRAEMVWSGGRWRVERFGSDSPGPTPSVTAPTTASEPDQFVDAASALTPFAP